MAQETLANGKLLAARAAIEAILKEHDIAGVCVLHMPGFVEVLSDLSPSYSCLSVKHVDDNHGLEIRVRSKLADYNGDVEAQRRDLEATAGMASSFAECLALNAIEMVQLAKTLDEKLGAKHTGLRPVSPPRTGRQ
jgi:hypothetical protein